MPRNPERTSRRPQSSSEVSSSDTRSRSREKREQAKAKAKQKKRSSSSSSLHTPPPPRTPSPCAVEEPQSPKPEPSLAADVAAPDCSDEDIRSYLAARLLGVLPTGRLYRPKPLPKSLQPSVRPVRPLQPGLVSSSSSSAAANPFAKINPPPPPVRPGFTQGFSCSFNFWHAITCAV